MILVDKKINEEIFDAFKGDLLESYVPKNHLDTLNGLLETVHETNFPGAILPIKIVRNEYAALVVFDQKSDWYKIAPILKAFTGQSFSSFTGEILIPDLQNLLDRYRRSLLSRFSVCELKLANGSDNFAALRSLHRAVLNYLNRPNLYSDIPLPTSFMIRNFEEALLIGDKKTAWKIIDTLDKNFKMDSMNLRFMEIQLFAEFGEWSKIVNLPDLRDICAARKTSIILNLILSALRLTYINVDDPINEQKEAYQEHVHGYAEFLFNSSTVIKVDPNNSVLLALEASIDPDSFQYFSQLEKILPETHPIREVLGDSLISTSVEKHSFDPTSSVLTILSQLKAIDSSSGRAALAEEFAKLSEEDQLNINRLISIHTQFDELDVTRPREPSNWIEWFEHIIDPNYIDYAAHARMGALEWKKFIEHADEELAEAIFTAINNSIDDPLQSDRIIECLPFFLKWLIRDEERHFVKSMTKVYSGFINLMALNNSQNSIEILGSSQILVSALLSSGIDRESYTQLLSDLDDICGEGIGVSQVYWILELVEELYQFPAPDVEARSIYLQKMAGKIRSIYSRLSNAQTKAVDLLFIELGLHVPTAAEIVPGNLENFWAKLKNKKIGIYTLTETAGRRAAKILEDLEPSVDVSVNSQHGGSDQLKALSENSDYFVISWLSAKHAATDFIRQYRPPENIIYAQGKGASSIIRSLESSLNG